MKTRPIIFSGNDVRAILEGRKTQFRRVVKFEWSSSREALMNQATFDPAYKCPYGQPGDRLWVRETWAPHADMPTRAAIYRCDPGGDYQDTITPNFRWRPSIHMPRWASRITLEIVSVRVERLQDISDFDAYKEGAESKASRVTGPYCMSYVEGFKQLWESINGPDSWDQNPWVWVIEFKEVKP